MIYRMPIDECPNCGARTPRIFRHRCLNENGHNGGQLAAELQAWIASQLAANSAQTGRPTRTLLQGGTEPSLTSARLRGFE